MALPTVNREKRFSLILVCAVVALNAFALSPELSINHVDLNDNVSHFAYIEGMAHALDTGANPFDFWSPECVMGFPVFRIYQPLGHALVVAAYFLTGKSIPLMVLFSWARFLSMALLPLAFFTFARLIELPWLDCAAVALLSPLISAADRGLFGLEYRSYTWYGYGMYPQSLSTLWMLPAIGFAYRGIRRGAHLTLAGIMLAVTILTHLIFGYIAAITICLIALLPADAAPFRVRLRRLLWIGVTSAVLAAFQLLSIFQDGYIANHGQLEPMEKWNSFGAERVLGWLFTGGLLDHERIPVLSLLALLGCVLAAMRLRAKRTAAPELFLLAGFVLWTLLYFGRPTWGVLLILFGITADMHLHRLIAGVQITLTVLAGIALASIWRRASGWLTPATAAVATAILLFPLVQERAAFLTKNVTTGRENLAAYEAQHADLAATLDELRQHGGRAFAGLGTGWGAQFKIGYVPFHNFLMTGRIPAVSTTYHSMSLPSDPMMHFDEIRAAHYRLFNVRSVAVPAATTAMVPFLAPRAQFGNFKIADAPGTGYFEVVDVAAAVPMSRDSFIPMNLRWLQSDWVDNKRHLLLDFGGFPTTGLPRLTPDNAVPNAPPPATPAGQVTSERQTGDTYEADLTAARSSYVLFRMTWHPNWRITIDGQPRPTVMLSPGFLGVAVDPGRHHVSAHYQPGPGRTYVAFAGLFAAMVMFAVERRFTKTKQ